MRKLNFLLGTLLVVSMLLAACGAEETSTTVPNTDVPPITSEATMTEEAATETPAVDDLTTTPAVPVTGEDSSSRLSNLLDYDVWNQNSEQIGEVEDMVLDVENTNISYVVIETGGFLDLGDKTVLIPWSSLDLQITAEGAQENAFVLMADPEMLNNANDMDVDSILPEIGETVDDWDADLRNFWEGGVVPDATQTGDATAVPETTATTTTGSDSGTVTETEQSTPLQGVMLASELLGATITLGSQTDTGTGTVDATAMPEATLDGTVMPESTATTDAGTGSGTGIGPDTQEPTDATIEDIIIDPDTGDILYLVLNTLFDDGERWIPIPLNLLNWDTTSQSFVFGGDSSALQNAPFFTGDQFPDTNTEGWDTDFNDFWQNNGTGDGSGTGSDATATPTP